MVELVIIMSLTLNWMCSKKLADRTRWLTLTTLVLAQLFCESNAGCSSSYELITFDACPGDQIYVIGAPTTSAPNTLTSNGTQCDNQDVYFSNQAVVPQSSFDTTKSFKFWNNNQVQWSSSNLTEDSSIFTVTQQGNIRTTAANYTIMCTFLVTFNRVHSCIQSPETIYFYKPSLQDQTYIVADVLSTFTVPYFSFSSIYCDQQNVAYSMDVTAGTTGMSTSFIDFKQNQMAIGWSTNTIAQAGTYLVNITASISVQQGTFTKSSSFTLTVKGNCANEPGTIIITPCATPATQTYSLSASSAYVTINNFTTNSLYCSQDDIIYTMTVTPPSSGILTTFITFAQNVNGGQSQSYLNRVSWYTSSLDQVGTYTITITGTITTSTLTFSNSIQFTLNVELSCLFSTETIAITPSQPPSSQQYAVGSGSAPAQGFKNFTVNSTICTQKDIVYSLQITPPSAGILTTFIHLQQSQNFSSSIWWSTSSSAQIGTYEITIVGTITADQTFTQTTSFTLWVYNCPMSTETISITSNAATPTAYTVGSAQSQKNIAFNDNSTACGSSDYVYSFSVTPITQGLSTSFITFTPSTKVVAWYTNNNTQQGTYSIKITATISAASTFTNSTSFNLTVTPSCLFSTENITLTPSSSTVQINYGLGSATGSTTISQFTQDSLICSQSDIVYSMTVSPTTNFITFIPSSRGVSWQTNSAAQVGTYNITITGKITAVSTFSKTTSFTLWVYNCTMSTETITITASAAPATQNYTVGAAAAFVSLNLFTEDSAACTTNDIYYSISVIPSTSGVSTTFIVLQPLLYLGSLFSEIVAWATLSNEYVGNYQITVTGTIVAASTFQSSLTFTLQVNGNCTGSIDDFNIFPSTVQSQSYVVSAPSNTYIVQAFNVSNSKYCTTADIIYTMLVTSQTTGQLTSFVTLIPSNRTASWVTSSLNDIGVYTINITGTIITYSPSTHTATASYTLVVDSCSTTTEIIKITPSIAPTAQFYSLGATSNSISINQFTLNSTFCSLNDITYQMTVTPVPSSSFISFTPNTRVVAWQTNNFAHVGTYSIQIEGKIFAASNWTQNLSFTLTVIASCSQSTEKNSVTASQNPPNVNYGVGDAQESLIISEFTENSQVCSSSDFVYSMQVTSVTAGLSTQFITFSPSTRVVAWLTNNNTQQGTYSIKINGTISAGSTWSASSSFNLTVTPSCLSLTENFVITASPGQSQKSYLVGSSQNGETITPFTSNSSVCNQNHIVYTLEVTPQTGAQFITINQTALKLIWQTSESQLVGVYSVVVTGTIATASQFVYNSTQFTLTVWNFKEPEVAEQEYTLNGQLLQITIGQFLVKPESLSSTFCVNQPVAYLGYLNIQSPIDLAKLEALPSWIQFQYSLDGTGTFSIVTSDQKLKDLYTIVIVIQFSDNFQTYGFTQFNLKMKRFINLVPVFQTPVQSSYNASCDSLLQLPQFSDPEKTTVTISYFFFSATFFTGDENGAIQIDKQCLFGTYQVTVILTDQNEGKSVYSFIIVLSDWQKNANNTQETVIQFKIQTKEFQNIFGEKLPKPLRNSTYQPPQLVGAPILIQSVSNTGVVTFKFGLNILVPQFTNPNNATKHRLLLQLQNYITQKVLELRMSNGDGNDFALTNWTAINLTETLLQVQVIFSSPIDVSAYSTDFLKATFLNTDIFVVKNGKGYLFNQPSDLITKAAIIPPQYLSKTAAVEQQKQIESLQNVSYTTITITLIIQLLGKKLISFVWLFFCAIQLIIFINQNVNFNLPAPAFTTIQALYDIISLNAFDKDEALDKIGAKEITKSPLFHNLGGIAFLVILVILAIIIVGLMIKFCKTPLFQRLVLKIKQMILWNFVIRYFYAVFLNFLFSAIITLKSEDAGIADIFTSSLILAALLVVVVGFTRLLVKLDSKFLEMTNVKKSFGMLYSNLKTEMLKTRLYNQLFFVQRTALVFTVAFKISFGIQACLLQFDILMHTIYLFGVRPYQTAEFSLPDKLNELFLVLAVVLLISISPWQINNMIRYQTAQAFIYLIGLFFVINFGLIFFRVGTEAYRKACLKMFKNKMKKQHEKILNERRTEIKHRLIKIAKRSQLVQFTELDDSNDPRPHYCQIPFKSIINTKQLFLEIEKTALQRALTNSFNKGLLLVPQQSGLNSNIKASKQQLNAKLSTRLVFKSKKLNDEQKQMIMSKVQQDKNIRGKIIGRKRIEETSQNTINLEKQQDQKSTLKPLENNESFDQWYSRQKELINQSLKQEEPKQYLQLQQQTKNLEKKDEYDEWHKRNFDIGQKQEQPQVSIKLKSSSFEVPQPKSVEILLNKLDVKQQAINLPSKMLKDSSGDFNSSEKFNYSKRDQQKSLVNEDIGNMTFELKKKGQESKIKPFESQLVFTQPKQKREIKF